VAALVSQIVYYRYFHALSPFPGPFWASISRLWLVYHTARGDEAEVCFELHKKHGRNVFTSVQFTNAVLLVSALLSGVLGADRPQAP
jgi:hypothetical protein